MGELRVDHSVGRFQILNTAIGNISAAASLCIVSQAMSKLSFGGTGIQILGCLFILTPYLVLIGRFLIFIFSLIL